MLKRPKLTRELVLGRVPSWFFSTDNKCLLSGKTFYLGSLNYSQFDVTAIKTKVKNRLPTFKLLLANQTPFVFRTLFQPQTLSIYLFSLLSQYQANPREGHLEQLLHIFAFLKRHPKLTLYLSPELPRMDYGEFRTNREDFAEIYRDAEEQLPHRMPTPRGRGLTMTAFVDASHAANKMTRRSHSGYVIFLNRAPIVWYSKRQQTVETSTFSAEFIALKVCLEAIEHLRFKLRCFGVPMPKGEATYVYCDNESVVKNTTNVESTLNKKHSSIAYHHCRWSVAAGIVTITHISTHENLADCFTKRLPANTRNYLFGNWTYWQDGRIQPHPLNLHSRGPSKADCDKISTDVLDGRRAGIDNSTISLTPAGNRDLFSSVLLTLVT
jgi:hypothetical protein